jgi:large subunit ribosomal protein L25
MALIAKGGVTKKVQANQEEAKHLFHDITGVAIFDIEVEGTKSRVILKDVQRDPVSRKVTHLTVMEITDEDIVKVAIPVVIEGTPKAVTKRAATLMVPMSQIELKAKVKDLPERILVDASKMKQNDKIVVADLKMGDSVEFLTSPQTVLASTKQLRGMAAMDESEGTPTEEVAADAATEESSAE